MRTVLHSPDVVLIGKDNDYSGVWVLTQPADDLVKLSSSWFTWYFHWLGNAQATWFKNKREKVSKWKRFIFCQVSEQVSFADIQCFNAPLRCCDSLNSRNICCSLERFSSLFPASKFFFKLADFLIVEGHFYVDQCNNSRHEWCMVLKKKIFPDTTRGNSETHQFSLWSCQWDQGDWAAFRGT